MKRSRKFALAGLRRDGRRAVDARGPMHAERAEERAAWRRDTSDAAVAAQKVYVAPGDLDPYYMFASGGHSGNVYVYGIPSMRHIVTIPVFTPYPATGYGFDDDSKAMLGDKLTWGDVHHPSLSETNGDYDGRWLFVNEINGRIARIDLRDFKTKQIVGPLPERVGQPRLVVRHAEHRVHVHGDPVLDPDSQGDGRRRSTSTRPTTRGSSPRSRSTRRRAT